jgi:TonB family protein
MSSNLANGRPFSVVSLPILLVLFTTLVATACNQGSNTSANNRAMPTNVTAVVKPTETPTPQIEPAAVGKEIKPVDGAAMRSVMPPEGAILGGVLNDIAVTLPSPDPAAARAAKESGKVTVEVLVNEKGSVVASSVVSGPQPLWSAAGAAAREARFDPPLYNGKPVKVAGVLVYEFR